MASPHHKVIVTQTHHDIGTLANSQVRHPSRSSTVWLYMDTPPLTSTDSPLLESVAKRFSTDVLLVSMWSIVGDYNLVHRQVLLYWHVELRTHVEVIVYMPHFEEPISWIQIVIINEMGLLNYDFEHITPHAF